MARRLPFPAIAIISLQDARRVSRAAGRVASSYRCLLHGTIDAPFSLRIS